jgi:hypothetical protein
MESINMCKGFAFKRVLVSPNSIFVRITPIFLVDAYAGNPAV